MNESDLRAELERRAPANWDLYWKRAESRETTWAGAARHSASRSEEGWAARWWEGDSPRFAAASSAEDLTRQIRAAARLPVRAAPAPAWPAGKSPVLDAPPAVEAPPDLFEPLGRLLAAESRGDAVLAGLSVRRGARTERIWNGRGADVSLRAEILEGMAHAIGRRDGNACEARALFRWDEEPALEPLARRLSDRATLPLSDRGTPLAHGEWLLDPAVGAALLAAIAPLFTARTLPAWVQRAQLFAPGVTVVDDAAADAPFDGEATPTRRIVLVDQGGLRARLHDLRSARDSGAAPTGHGVRVSFRTPPAAGPRRLFFETSRGAAPRELLAAVRRGLFASALTAPVRIDVERDRFEIEFTGISVVAGHAQGPVAGARAKGRLSQLLRRISAVSTDRQFFPSPYPTGSPTLWIDRAEFD
ncbi:MAG: metallopeptidase TldD-related protein [Acidobacteriota bacterium]